MRWTVRTESSGNPLTDLHANSFPAVAELYDGQDSRLRETYERRVETVLPLFSRAQREALVNALRAHMQVIGASDASLEQLNKLRDERSVAVVTGQQAGLFTGPLYSVYKAMSAIGLAKRLERELHRPVVPVFWVASEDHDWAEVNHAYLLDGADNVRKITLSANPDPHEMVYYTNLTQGAVEDVLRQAHQLLPDGPYKAEMLNLIRDSWSQGTSMSVWFARILAHLVKPHGLVMIDPCLPSVRDLVRSVWTKALEDNEGIAQSLTRAYRQVEEKGFKPAVVRDEQNTTLFHVVDGKRYVLERTEQGKLRVRGLGVERTVAEWVALAEESPTSFSSNVLLRPVVQDHLLPTVAYVGGPAEIAYHSLSRGVFNAFGRTLPPLVLRNRLTLYPASVVRSMKKWDVTMTDVERPVDLVNPLLTNLGADRIDSLFAKLRSETTDRWRDFTKEVVDLGPQIADMARAQAQREIAGLHRLEHKTRHLFRERHTVQVEQLQHIERWLWADGNPQERRLCPLSFWANYGFDWLTRLDIFGDYQSTCAVYHVEL